MYVIGGPIKIMIGSYLFLFNTQCLSLFVGVGRYLLQILLKIKIFIVLLQLSKGIVCLSFCLKLFYIIFFW